MPLIYVIDGNSGISLIENDSILFKLEIRCYLKEFRYIIVFGCWREITFIVPFIDVALVKT